MLHHFPGLRKFYTHLVLRNLSWLRLFFRYMTFQPWNGLSDCLLKWILCCEMTPGPTSVERLTKHEGVTPQNKYQGTGKFADVTPFTLGNLFDSCWLRINWLRKRANLLTNLNPSGVNTICLQTSTLIVLAHFVAEEPVHPALNQVIMKLHIWVVLCVFKIIWCSPAVCCPRIFT